MKLLVVSVVAIASAQPPAWIQRAVPPPIVTWREADVLGTSVVEGIVVSRDFGGLTVNVVDSRFNPPRIVRQREVRGSGVRWLRGGRRDGLARDHIAIDLRRPGGETAYLLRVGPRFTLEVVRTFRGTKLRPQAFRR
jgi:hypothetical protein